MSRFRAWGMAAALSVGAAGTATAAAPQVDVRPWYKKIFFAPKPTGPTGPTVRSGPVTGAPGRRVTVTAPLPPDVVAEALAAERDAWSRRMDVCLRLKQIALQKDDQAMLREVEEVERQATALYQQRATALGVPRVKAPLPLPPAAGFSSFDLAPEKPADPAAAAARLTAPAAPVPVTETAGIREVKP